MATVKDRIALNAHIGPGEDAWLRTFAKREDLSITMAVRQIIRDHMRAELAAEAIRCAVRCSWQDCIYAPSKDGDRPDLCRTHQVAAADRVREIERQSKQRRRAR